MDGCHPYAPVDHDQIMWLGEASKDPKPGISCPRFFLLCGCNNAGAEK